MLLKINRFAFSISIFIFLPLDANKSSFIIKYYMRNWVSTLQWSMIREWQWQCTASGSCSNVSAVPCGPPKKKKKHISDQIKLLLDRKYVFSFQSINWIGSQNPTLVVTGTNVGMSINWELDSNFTS